MDTQFVLRAAGAPSPFTYIIVDRQGKSCIQLWGRQYAARLLNLWGGVGRHSNRLPLKWAAAGWSLPLPPPPRIPAGGTRTCIHTPGEPMQPEELTPELAAAVLDGAALVYFDGRLTEAAVVLAAAARERGVPVLVEAERLRPGELLILCCVLAFTVCPVSARRCHRTLVAAACKRDRVAQLCFLCRPSCAAHLLGLPYTQTPLAAPPCRPGAAADHG